MVQCTRNKIYVVLNYPKLKKHLYKYKVIQTHRLLVVKTFLLNFVASFS